MVSAASRSIAAAVAILVLSACGLAENPVIDTWPVGAPFSCERDNRCHEMMRVGLAGLDERDPGHAAVVESHLHSEGAFVDPAGHRILVTRSGGCCSVLVVTLADGSIHAIGVGY